MPHNLSPTPRNRTKSLAALAAPFLLASAQGVWTQVPPAPGDPPANVAGALVFADACGESFLYGGFGLQVDPASLWSWDGASWTQVAAMAPPGERWDHALSYDAASQKLVLFGGGHGVHLSDTWEYECGANTWLQHQPATAPSGRFRMQMVFDAARGVHVLFGGEGPFGLLNDTWEWDGTTWMERATATQPPARRMSALAYDQRRQRVVLFGGLDSADAPLGDTWEYDGLDWVLRTSASAPDARAFHSMEWDRTREIVVLWGGAEGGWHPNTVPLPELWEWDGTNWTQRASVGSPPVTSAANFAFDAVRDAFVLFGGAGETWLLGGNGTSYCDGTPNSTGLPGRISAHGSAVVTSNDLTLVAEDLPPHSFGFFLTSQTQGLTQNPGGSQGNLCLSGAIGRYVGPGQIRNAGATGAISLLLDLTQTPQPMGFVSVNAGETWNYQAWTRDSVGGMATSNFTNGLEFRYF